ncbi:MAG: cysteine--tRNA ligase [Planctomycetes bacterium]|nr:cysteine--tRNA ligase [Planctomycetota bacterium]
MTFHVYNTLTRQKEEFRTLEPGVVRMYNCGPTVYGRAHIGNLRSFLFADTLRRWLEYQGFAVKQVMNITDVGHILADADEGEDKIEAQARKENKDPWAISRGWTELFHKDLAALGFRKAAANPKASEHIPEMLEIIEGLLQKGYAYQTGGDVYFEVSKFARYGRLSGNKVEELDAGNRIEVREEKRHPADFALWKSDKQHLMKWTSRFGPDGYPGWHIECSAMSRKHLGDQIDIHTGGEDNIFPHHECEIAQTEAFTGRAFASYWVHSKFLQVDGGKMSKSLGNVYNLDDVLARGFQPRQLRYCLIRGHYRAPLNFTWEILKESAAALENLDDLVVRLRKAARGEGASPSADDGLEAVGEAKQEFEAALDDDLNVPRALAELFKLRTLVLEGQLGQSAAAAALQFVKKSNEVFGVMQTEEELIGDDVQRLIDERQAARKRKDFKESDRIRDYLLAQGIVLEDTPSGVSWKKKG